MDKDADRSVTMSRVFLWLLQSSLGMFSAGKIGSSTADIKNTGTDIPEVKLTSNNVIYTVEKI